MATRIYLPDGLTAVVSPVYSADWERTADATRIFCSPLKQNTAFATKTSSEAIITSPYDVLARQYVSDPLVAQTLTGTVKGQIRCMESAVAADFCRALVIKVVSNDGATLRGTLLSHFPAALESEYAITTLTNRYFPPAATALSDVICQLGDRIVIEIGTRSFNAVTTSYTASHRFGDVAASDLPEDEIDVNDYNPWIEFSMDLDFVDRLKISQVVAQTEWQQPPKLKVSQAIAQTEWQQPGKLKISQVAVQVEYVEGTPPTGGADRFFLLF